MEDYPTGVSQWNPLEPRRYSAISKRGPGQPLVDDSPVERLMRETRTPIGLTISGSLDARNESAGIKLLPERRKQIRPRRPSVPPPGNGTLLTRPSRNQFSPAARANRGPNLEKSFHFFRGGCPAWGKPRTFEANPAILESEGASN